MNQIEATNLFSSLVMADNIEEFIINLIRYELQAMNDENEFIINVCKVFDSVVFGCNLAFRIALKENGNELYILEDFENKLFEGHEGNDSMLRLFDIKKVIMISSQCCLKMFEIDEETKKRIGEDNEYKNIEIDFEDRIKLMLLSFEISHEFIKKHELDLSDEWSYTNLIIDNKYCKINVNTHLSYIRSILNGKIKDGEIKHKEFIKIDSEKYNDYLTKISITS